MEQGGESRRSSGGGGSARRPRTDLSRPRRPHSQPDRLLVSRAKIEGAMESGAGGAGGGGGADHQEVCKAEEKSVRVFKRREMGIGSDEKGKGGAKNGGKANGIGRSKGVKNKQPAEEKLPDAKRRRQRMVLEGSDNESEPSDKKGNGSRDSSSPRKRADSKPVTKPAPVAEPVAVRKSSRVVKRRTFDDEIDFEEVMKRRKKPTQSQQQEIAARQDDDNTDSADDEHPRKKPRRGSIQELQSAAEKPKPKGGGAAASPEAAVPKEKPLTARQRAMQAKENGAQEQASTSGKDEALKADSPGDSIDSKEKSAAVPLTARQRSLQACKDGDGNFGGLLEFPEGLNHNDRRRKAKLTDEEKLAKKAEAANKRKLQVEKNAKEMQASAIQKILNQDSNRKKREEKLQKQKQELAEVRLIRQIFSSLLFAEVIFPCRVRTRIIVVAQNQPASSITWLAFPETIAKLDEIRVTLLERRSPPAAKPSSRRNQEHRSET